MKTNKKEMIIEYATIILGNIILSIGVGLFIIPNKIISGGLAGVANALEPIIHINPNITINVLTIVFFLLGSIVLGKKFALKTVMSAFLYPTCLTIISTFADRIHITDNPLLASIYGGAFIGFGVGLVFRTGASTGGMDIPPLIINKFTGIPLPALIMLVDGLTVLLGIIVYNVEASLIGLLGVWVSSIMVNKALTLGGHETKNVFVISKNYTQILQEIYTTLDRGVTILSAKGGYTMEERPVLMIAVSKKQFPILNHIVSHIDPEAFVIVQEAKEVQGLGFTYKQEL